MNNFRVRNLYGIVIFCTLLLSISKTSGADEFDVDTAAEFRAALIASQANGETDFINLAPGTYETGGVPFSYSAGLFENFGLNISGSGKNSTTLSGTEQTAVLIIDTSAVLDDFNVNINLDDLAIVDGSTSQFSTFAGGLTIISDNGNIMIDNCNFLSNTGGLAGGACINTFGQVSVSNSAFQMNESLSSDGGGALIQGNFILLTDNGFILNETSDIAARGGGLSAVALSTNGGDPANGTMILNGNIFNENSSEGHGGASLIADFGVLLQGNGFEDNIAGEAGAGGLYLNVLNNDPGDSGQNTFLTQLFSNLFRENISDGGDGGGAIVSAGVDIIMANNIFAENIAASGGGALLEAPDIIATNNTLTLNAAGGFPEGNGGGLLLLVTDDDTANIYNNIIYNNIARTLGQDMFVDDDVNLDQIGSTVNLEFNDFSDFFSVCENDPECDPNITTLGNIDKDPKFVGAQDGNVNIKSNSPARRAGSSDAPQLPSSDAAGNPVGDPPDMGALQFVGDGGGGNGGSCSLTAENTGYSGAVNTFILLAVPMLVLLFGGIVRKTKISR